MSAADPSAPVLLVGGDLNGAARVEAAAGPSGRRVVRTDATGVAAALEAERPALVLVDLDMGGAGALETLASVGGRVKVVAFFSHVDQGAGRSAREAGIAALPRGRFWRELQQLVAALDDDEA